ncbi:hypothetical protein V2J09_023755 [Rumex salicifolius]
MEEERGNEIEETSPLLGSSTTTTTNNESSTLDSNKSVRTKVPEVEVHLYRQGKGPITVFKSALGGWDQDQLEVKEILHQHGFKAIYAFSSSSGRSVPIRFHPKNGRSVLPYKDGAVIHVDGEPQDPLIKPITKILLGISFIVILISLGYNDNSAWLNKLKLKSLGIPPWLIACANH